MLDIDRFIARPAQKGAPPPPGALLQRALSALIVIGSLAVASSVTGLIVLALVGR